MYAMHLQGVTVTKGSRPVKAAIVSAASASGQRGARGRLRVGAGGR